MQNTLKATFGTTATGAATVGWSERSEAAVALMKRISARYDGKTYTWTFDAAFLPLVREEAERGMPVRDGWCAMWPQPFDGDGKQVRGGYYRYATFPATPEEATRLLALREQHNASQTSSEQQAPEPVSTSSVTTSVPAPVVERPVVATVVGSREQVGAFAVVRESNHDRFGRVLVCIRSEYVRGDEDREGDMPTGYYSDYAEPTEDEHAAAEYQRLQAKIDADRAYEERQQQAIQRRRQAELDAIRAEGREPTFFEDLFAGTSDE